MSQDTESSLLPQQWCNRCEQYKDPKEFSPANSLCKKCKATYRRSKYIPKPKPPTVDRCSKSGCNYRSGKIVTGLCSRHYQEQRKTRKPELYVAAETRRKVKAKTRLPLIIKDHKICPRCEIDKSVVEYGKNARNIDGLTTWCFPCEREYKRKLRAEQDPVTKKAQGRKWNLKRKFGITPDEYDALFEAQDKKCAACGRSGNTMDRMMPVDHNHVTGQVRGILCRNCNIGIGMFKDDPDKLLSAAEYLLKYIDILKLPRIG